MSNYELCKRAKLDVTPLSDMYGHGVIDHVILASEVEEMLQNAKVVYGVWDKNGCRFAESQFPGHTHTAMLLNITPIKKKTKAEAALELLEKLAKDHDKLIQPEWQVKEAKRILNMKV